MRLLRGCLGEDGAEFGEPSAFEGVPGPVALLLRLDDSCKGETAQVVTDGGLTEPDGVSDVGDACGAARLRAEEGEDAQSSGISDGLEELG